MIFAPNYSAGKKQCIEFSRRNRILFCSNNRRQNVIYASDYISDSKSCNTKNCSDEIQ